MNGFDYLVVFDALPILWSGIKFSFGLTLVTFVCGLAFGSMLAVFQHLNVPILSSVVTVYNMIIRSIPLIMVLFWVFFLLPPMIGYINGSGRPYPIGSVYTAFITFTLFESSYYCEIIRSGLRAVPQGQYEASSALSLSRFKTYILIILPQVGIICAPMIATQTIILFQDTSLVYVLSITDLLGAASKTAQITGRIVELYIAVAIIYFFICFFASQCVNALRRKLSERSISQI